MKLHPLSGLQIVEATDVYFNDVHNRWLPVPKHWVGDFVSSHTYAIRSK
jgi:hypothetical protein